MRIIGSINRDAVMENIEVLNRNGSFNCFDWYNCNQGEQDANVRCFIIEAAIRVEDAACFIVTSAGGVR